MKLFNKSKYNVLSLEKFELFLDKETLSFPDKDSDSGKYIIKEAEGALNTEIPQLYASVYARYTYDGNRTEYETPYFQRRAILKKLLLGEIIEKKGRFISKMIDVLWLIMEETSWVIPAHNFGRDAVICEPESDRKPLPEMFDENISYIDLFSAETGALIAFVYHYMKEEFDKKIPNIVNDRIKYLIDRRIIKPYIQYNNMWWMGYGVKRVNNWTPWIASNVLCAAALVCGDISERQRVFNKSIKIVDKFIDTYKEDGGCDEGPSYWSVASSCLFDFLEIVYDLTDGKADYFDNPLVYNMFDYIRKVHLCNNYFAAYADCPSILYTDGIPFGARMGLKTNNKPLTDFSMSLTDEIVSVDGVFTTYRSFRDICTPLPKRETFVPQESDILPDLQLAVIRKENFILSAKGGNNAESHNHNDIGNFILFKNQKPLIIEIGKPTYTKDVFSSRRYTVFPINSTWHNLPIINGCGEKEGERFFADLFYADENMIKIEYQSAYEKCAKAEKCVREIYVSDNGAKIKENIICEGDDILFNYYLQEKPVQNENVFIFEDGTKIICPKNADCFIEPVPVNDESVINIWKKDTLYRLVIKGIKDFEIEIL